MLRRFVLGLGLLAAAGIARADEAETVRAYFAAYNAHDVEGVIKLIDPEFAWLSIEGDAVSVEVRGVEPIRKMLTDSFRSLPSGKSEPTSLTALGPWVTVHERALWTAKDGTPRSQSALSVYEVRGGKLRRVWYYPVVK